MPTTSDLVDLLHERSAHPPAAPGLDDLHRRIGRRRTARTAGVAAAALALAAVVTVPIAVTGGGRDGRTGEPPDLYAGMMRLVAAEVAAVPATSGETTVSFTFTPTSYDFELGLLCRAGPTGRIEASINGRRARTEECSVDQPAEPFEKVVDRYVPANEQTRWDRYGVVPNVPVTVVATVRGGTAGRPEPLTLPGRATLLVYGPAPMTERPLPVTAPPGTTLINSVNALDAGANETHPMLFSVPKVSGRQVTLLVEAFGTGTVAVYANRVLQETLEFPAGDVTKVILSVDPAKVAADVPEGEMYTVGVVTSGFTAPLWRITALSAPPGKPLG